jgi:hypothetical protein
MKIYFMVTIITFIWNHNINTFCKICLNLKWSDSVELLFFLGWKSTLLLEHKVDLEGDVFVTLYRTSLVHTRFCM